MTDGKEGYFGFYGGKYVPETIMSALDELEREYNRLKDDEDFQDQVDRYLTEFAGRPSPLTFASRLTESWGGGKIYLKREDLNHTGAHKINNTIGQILLTRAMGKGRIIAETGAGQHGVATATVAALFGVARVVSGIWLAFLLFGSFSTSSRSRDGEFAASLALLIDQLWWVAFWVAALAVLLVAASFWTERYLRPKHTDRQ